MPKLCGTVSSFYGGGMVTGQPIGTMIGSRMINNAQAGFIIGAVIMGFRIRGACHLTSRRILKGHGTHQDDAQESRCLLPLPEVLHLA